MTLYPCSPHCLELPPFHPANSHSLSKTDFILPIFVKSSPSLMGTFSFAFSMFPEHVGFLVWFGSYLWCHAWYIALWLFVFLPSWVNCEFGEVPSHSEIFGGWMKKMTPPPLGDDLCRIISEKVPSMNINATWILITTLIIVVLVALVTSAICLEYNNSD